MPGGTKRRRAAEPGDVSGRIPGGFPGQAMEPEQPAGESSHSDGGWLEALILSPLRLAKRWLTGDGAPAPAPPQRTHAQTHAQAHARRAGQHRRRRQQQHQHARGQRRLLMGGSGSRMSRNAGLVHSYTARPAWAPDLLAAETASSAGWTESQRADTQSILSVDSSLGLRSETPRELRAEAAAPEKRAAARDAADAWLAQLRRKIEAALSASAPAAAAVATAAYDRLRLEERRIDERLDAAQERAARPALPGDAAAVIAAAMAGGFTAELNNVPVTARDMATLQDGRWLNDEVINFYMQLIMDRAERAPDLPRVHAFNTFFYSTLCESGYARVRRWTRRTRLFDKDLVIVPVHLGVHWCCAVIDLRQKAICYYDALLGDNPDCLRRLLRYLCDESRDKGAAEVVEAEWSLVCDKQIPRQRNGYDCGVFAIMFAEHAARRAPFQFSQETCPLLRRRVAYEIATGALI
ncbi:SUMO1 sentrin specific peptidase 1 [Coemansia javaensis]|uniref:SUMO1 sentrin specific peptidase 1 n=1 Tax=Coemansia javaensis TaxID=2761396 RepID=A0A9W8HMA2_9FUNG|nr:SUMO1 sentrin specific peptidase 1 [Coemansia javaensis]